MKARVSLAWVRRVSNRRDLPAICAFDQLPGLATAIHLFPVAKKNKVKIHAGNCSIALYLNLAMRGIEIGFAAGYQFRKVPKVANSNFRGVRRFGFSASIRIV